MTIPRNLIRLGADILTVFALVLSTDAFLPLLINGYEPTNISQGSPVMQAGWALVYAITMVHLVRRQGQVISLIRANKALAFLVVLALVSILWSVDPGSTLHNAVVVLFSALFALDLSIRYTLEEQIRLICISMALVIGASVFVELFLPGFVPGSEYQGTAWHGVFGNKNEFGRLVLLGSAAFLALPFQSKWTKVAIMAAGGALAVLSQSVGAICYLAVIFGFFICVPVLKWKPQKRNIAIAASAVAVFLTVFLVAQNFDKVTVLVGKDPTLSRRTGLWEMSLADIERSPVLGYGYGAFWSKTSQPANLIREEVWKEAPHSHNGYIELALGLGLVGLGTYFFVFLAMVQRSYRFYLNDSRGNGKWPLLFLAYVSVYQLTESAVVSPNGILWIVFCCLAFSLPRASHDRVVLSTVAPREFASSSY